MTKAQLGLKQAWGGKIAPQTQCPPKTFTMRLTAKQRQKLETEAKGKPLGTYVRSRLFENDGRLKPSRVRMNGDPKDIAKILAVLGHSNLTKNISDLRDLANAGALPVSEDVCKDLNQACQDISNIRLMLIKALGLRRAN